MGSKRRKHASEFKAKVAREAVKGVRALSELSAVYRVHATAIGTWERRLVDGWCGGVVGGAGACGRSVGGGTGAGWCAKAVADLVRFQDVALVRWPRVDTSSGMCPAAGPPFGMLAGDGSCHGPQSYGCPDA